MYTVHCPKLPDDVRVRYDCIQANKKGGLCQAETAESIESSRTTECK